MAPGRSTKIISMIKWIRTSRLSMRNSVFRVEGYRGRARVREVPELEMVVVAHHVFDHARHLESGRSDKLTWSRPLSTETMEPLASFANETSAASAHVNLF